MYKSADRWSTDGVVIRNIRENGVLIPLDKENRETALSFFEVGECVEVETAIPSWHKKIETLGIRPSIINRYSNAEIRLYEVPSDYFRFPFHSLQTTQSVDA